MKRFGVPALAAAALILIAGSFLARRSLAPSTGASPPDARPGSVYASRAGSAGPQAVSPGNAAPALVAPRNLADSLQAFMNRATAIESSALAEVEEWIERQGGAAALAKLRERLLATPADRDALLRNIFLARLIPHVAVREPSALPAALALSRELLEARQTDDWIRFQVLAGLGGLPSRRLSAGGLPGQDLVFAFGLEDRADFRRGPFEDSLAEGLRADPSLQGILAATLSSDPSDLARAVAARVLAASGAASAEAALMRAVQTDEDGRVRAAGLSSLADLRSASLPSLVRQALLQDPATDVHHAALKLLPTSLPYDREIRDLLSGCLRTGTPDDALGELPGAVFEYMARNQAHDLHPELVSFLLRNSQQPGVMEVYAAQAVRLQMTQFLPVLQALSSTTPEGSVARELLDRTNRQLTEAPRYAAMAEQTRKTAASIRELWDEVNRPGTTEERKAEQIARISTLTFELWKVQAELAK